MLNIIFIGAPGVGKGTQSALIEKDYSIAHIATGDMLRENISNGTELGKTAKSYMDKGELVPDSLVIDMLTDRIKKDDCKNGYLLDGFPRTLVQAEKFAEISQKIGKPVECVLALDVDFNLLKERITGRRVCSKCGAIYHIHNHPSKNINPSKADREATIMIIKAMNLVGIRVLDHLIVSNSDYFSFKEHCII